MNLTVRIHDKEYKEEVAQGITFSEEYNETLDSGTVRLTHVRGQIKDLKPYDDVYIYDSDYDFDSNIVQWRKGGDLKDNPFYRHLLVDQFSEEIINLSEGIFSYTIELFSETKGLEVVQCPNVSVTQPLNVKKKVDIYTYLVRFTNLYSPKYKTIDKDNAGCWAYTQKYRIAPELEGVFSGFYSQDFTLSNPTLRDILSTLMITKDMIPYVKDNVIYAKDISKRTGTYDIAEEQNTGRVNRIVGQMSSADYCDGVRRQYSDALSSEGVCNFVEYLGFRNKDEALMTLANMGLETTNRLYRVKRCNLCFYKKAKTISEGIVSNGFSWMLYKVDIAPLIKTDIERGLLSQDWRELDREPNSIEEMSKYKLSTVQYTIGSNKIIGWGEKYQKFNSSIFSVWDVSVSTIENLVKMLDVIAPQGSVDIKKYQEDYGESTNFRLLPYSYTEMYDATKTAKASMSQKFKTIFFEIEYEGFYNGALIHTRDKARDNIYQNDNVSSSLTLLEKDGISQKEKLNRFANKTHVINGRLDGVNYDIAKLLQLGATGTIGCDNDVIIYRREYSIYNNYISVSYAGIQDYVLKNFYTSVYAKYRVNQLMSYGESTSRAENRKVILSLSKKEKYKNDNTTFLEIDNDDSIDYSITKTLSAFYDNSDSDSIDSAVIKTSNGSFYVDCYKCCSGNNMLFNISMPDNISGGVFVKKWATEYKLLTQAYSDESDYYIGSTQDWYDIVDDAETGNIDYLSFILFHRNQKDLYLVDNDSVVSNFYDKTQNLPKILDENMLKDGTNIIKESDFLYKDNKERINMSFQIEPISDNKDIIISRFLGQLSNLMISDNIQKINANKTVKETYIVPHPVEIKFRKAKVIDDYGIYISTGNPDKWLDNDIKGHGVENGVEFSSPKWFIQLTVLGYTITWQFTPSFVYTDKPNETGRTYRYFNGDGEYNIYKKGIGGLDTDITMKINQVAMKRLNADETDFNEEGFYYFVDIDDMAGSSHLTDFKFDNISLWGTNICEQNEKESVIKKNMFVEYRKKTIDNNIADFVIQSSGDMLPDGFSLDNVNDIFFLTEESEPILKIDVTKITEIDGNGNIVIKDGIKSINYWYFNFDAAYTKDYSNSNYVYQYTPEKSGYNFVFGINLYPEDIKKDGDKRYVDIYITKTINRDERVFDGIGRQVGIIHNCVDKEGNYIAPTQQEYDTINEYPESDITITLQSAMGNHTKQWKCYQSEIIQPNFSIDEKEYKAKHGTSVKYWIDGSGKKHNDGYAMVVNNNETLTFYGEDWWKTLDISNMSTVERHLSPTYIDDTYVAVPRSLPKTFNITGDIKAYPVTVKGTVELTIEYNGKTTSKSHDFSVELEEFDDKTEIPNPVFGITTDDQDAASIFSLYYRKYTSDDEYKLVWQIRTTLTGANYEDKGELTLKAGVAINEIIQPYLLQE